MHATPPLKEMISTLIGTPSVSSTQHQFDMSNQGVIDLLANWLAPLGFDVQLTPVEGHPGKSNLIARIGSGTNGLLLSGHSDTVPFDEHLWQSDPFAMQEQDDKWFGLGSCDMKSFFAIAIEAIKPLLNENLTAPIVILATADEESSMSGARQLAKDHLRDISRAIIGEPTDLRPITRHKGIMMANLRVEGTSGHSSEPDLGKNAIEGIHEAIAELMRYRLELKDQYVDPHFAVSYPTLNFGCIHGGDNPNRICDHAELEFDLRSLPSMDMTDFIDDMQARIQSRLPQYSVSLKLLHEPVPAFENPDSALAKDIHAELLASAGNPSDLASRDDISNHNVSNDPTMSSVAFGTEAPFLGALDLDTVVIGPGSIHQAHQPNEYLPTAQINPAIDLIRSLASRQCVTPSTLP